MPLIYSAHITRSHVQGRLDTLFIFGDNLARWGLGGQAKETRGEPNAVGLPTKRSPKEFLTDDDLEMVVKASQVGRDRLLLHITRKGVICVSSQRIGTGRAQLAVHAPIVDLFYKRFFKSLEWEGE